MLFQQGAQRKTDTKKRCNKELEESPDLSFAQMTKGEMMKKGLCFECDKCGHGAKQCKTKDETSAADGIQVVQKWTGESALQDE